MIEISANKKMSNSKKIVIIGAGISGLVSIKACLEEELIPVCYEQSDDYGGVWVFSENSRPSEGATVFKNITTNTCRTTMNFSDFPAPREEGIFMHHERYLEYIRDYAKNFDLITHISFNVQVLQLYKAKCYERTGKWCVRIKNLKTNEENEEIFDGVIVCSGYLKDPIIPDISGISKFTGKIMHAKAYKNEDILKNKKVLIVGNAFTAGDIAVDATNSAKEVCLSIGNGMWIFPRFSKSDPVEFQITRFVFSFPLSLVGKILELHCNARINHQMLGLNPKPPFNSALMFNDEIQYKILTGRIKIKNFLTEFTETGVKFDDNSLIDFDLVIFATGYTPGVEFIEPEILPKFYKDMQLYKMVWPISLPHATLGVVGFINSLGPTPPVCELQARWVARVLAERCTLPGKAAMLKEINEAKQEMVSRYGKHVVRFEYLLYRDSVADEIGVTPKFWSLLFMDPKLAFMCFFGPAFPAQYRLLGPHKWKDASKVCYSAVTDTYFGIIPERKKSQEKNGSSLLHYFGYIASAVGLWATLKYLIKKIV